MIKVAMSPVDGADPALLPPLRATPLAAGYDLCANFSDNEAFTLAPFARALVPTGFSMALPEGYEAQIRPRSGLAYKHGVTIANAPGTIDADYRGEVKVLLINLGEEPFEIHHGERIAQMVIAPVTSAEFEIVDTLDITVRGAGGFGSTGR